MEKTYYFLGFGAIGFILFGFISNSRATKVTEIANVVQTPEQFEEIGQQLGFISNFSLSALRKIDNPGVFDFAQKLNAHYFDLFISFKTVASDENYHVTYQPTADDKRKLHLLKSLRLEHFEPAYLKKLIPELEKIHQITNQGLPENISPELVTLFNEIDELTQKYLDISRNLIAYEEHL